MNYKILISILCIFLVVSIPIVYAERLGSSNEDELGYEEVKGTRGVIKGFVEKGKFLEGEETSLIINVKKYEPAVITADVLEEQNLPVYVYLSALPVEGLSFPRIKSISVSAIGGNRSFITGGFRYFKPMIYSWDDLGYITFKLKRIEKEKEVPENIDVKLKARIRYESEVTSHLIGGKESKVLKEEGEISSDELLSDSRYVFFGGKGRINAERIHDKYVKFALYNSEGDLVSRFGVREGRESGAYSLVRGSPMPEDFVRVRVDEVVDETLDSVVININNIDQKFYVGDSIFDWRISKIDTSKEEIVFDKGGLSVRVGGGKINGQDAAVNAFEDMISGLGGFDVKEFKKGEKPKAKFNWGKREFEVGSFIGDCRLENIKPDEVVLYNTKTRKSYRLVLKAKKERYEYGYGYYYGYGLSDTLSAGECNTRRMLILEGIDTKKLVKITLLSGRKVGYTESVFWIHLPVEKRAIKLSPRMLDSQINKTRKLIEKLSKNIDELDKVVEYWRKACLITVGAMLLSVFFGIGGPSEKGAVKKVGEEVVKKAGGGAARETVRALEKEKAHEKITGYTKIKYFETLDGKKIYVRDEEMKKGVIRLYVFEGRKPIDVTYNVFLDNEGKKHIFDPSRKGFVLYSGLSSAEKGRVFVTEVDGKKAIIVPLVSDFGIRGSLKDFKKYGDDLYAVVYEDKSIDIYAARGEKYDVGDEKIEADKDILCATLSFDTVEGKNVYRFLEGRYLREIRRAEMRGESFVRLNGVRYRIDKARVFSPTSLSCTDVMSEWQCALIFNVCDPVICPSSRCNFGGEYRLDNVVQGGLIASLFACAKNFIAFKSFKEGGVIIPFCVSGILASMKNIRSFLQGYERCLISAKVEGKSTGICDKIRSIFICETIWQEFMNLINYRGVFFGLLSKATRKASGGGEYLEGPGKLEKTKRALNYFVNDYATYMFLAYKGRTTREIGAEVCKRAVGGVFPNIGELFEEMAEPEDPVQFTAYLEEFPYAPTQHQSKYSVYYHIYAGSPRLNRRVRYVVYLRAKGKPYYKVDEGIIDAGDFVDKKKDFITTSYYEEICVSINGVESCGFKKVVSTSFGLEKYTEWYMRKFGGLGPRITSKEQCVPSEGGGLRAPFAAEKITIKRVCALSNPGLTKEERAKWVKVGDCGFDKKGRHEGYCWEYIGLEKYPSLEQGFKGDICVNQGGVWCYDSSVNGSDMKCKEGYAVMFDYHGRVGNKLRYGECCIVSEDELKDKEIRDKVCVKIKEVKKEEKKVEEVEKKEKTPDDVIKEIKNAKKSCDDVKELCSKYEKTGILRGEKLLEAKFNVGLKCYNEDKFSLASSYFKEVKDKSSNETLIKEAYIYLIRTNVEWGKKACRKNDYKYDSDCLDDKLWYTKNLFNEFIERCRVNESEVSKLNESIMDLENLSKLKSGVF